MRTLINGVMGLLLGLTMLGGMVAVASAQTSHASTPTHAQTTAAQSQACAQDQADGPDTAAEQSEQAKESQSEATESKATDTDNVDLQCGDQTGPDTGGSAVSGQFAVGGGQQAAALIYTHGFSLQAAQLGTSTAQVQQASPPAATGCTAEDQTQDGPENGTPETQESTPTTTGTPEANDQHENDCQPAPGTFTEGKSLLPQAKITVAQAISAAQGKATGQLGDVKLVKNHGKLVFNVEIGDQDVTVDASNGHVVSVNADHSDHETDQGGK